MLMALSATRQYGHETTHLVPYLIKAATLCRVAKRLSQSHHHPTDGPSIIEYYLDANYGRSQQVRHRMLMQALYSGRLVLLIDATCAERKEDSKWDDGKNPELTKSVIDAYLLERVMLEVPRCVVTGDFSDAELGKLRATFAALEVRQGLKADHDDGLDAWYAAQNESFSYDVVAFDEEKKASKTTDAFFTGGRSGLRL